jgi:UDP-N-acetylglucosamine:LPS N-acetylglucosamine transferase
MALGSRDAAIVVSDSEVSELLLKEVLRLVSDKEEREKLSRNIAMMAERDADVRIASELIKLMEG